MFLFRSYDPEKKVENVQEENTITENTIPESIYIISLNGEPVCYKKDRLDVFKKVSELKDELKFNLVCQGNKVYDEDNFDKDFCKIYSKTMNTIFERENLEFTITWKEVCSD